MKAASQNIANAAAAVHAQLIARIAETADREAFAELFRHFAPRLKSFLLRQGADGPAADELAQEVMLVVWRKAARFDPAKASASTWIYAIARNLRIDVLRKERRPEFDPDDPALVADAEPPPEDRLSAEQEGRRVRAALDALPEDQAAVKRLSFFEDKPHNEIARELGIPLGTVKSRIRLALGRFRAALGEKR